MQKTFDEIYNQSQKDLEVIKEYLMKQLKEVNPEAYNQFSKHKKSEEGDEISSSKPSTN